MCIVNIILQRENGDSASLRGVPKSYSSNQPGQIPGLSRNLACPLLQAAPKINDCHADMGKARRNTKCDYGIGETKLILLYRVTIISEILKVGSSSLLIGGCSISMRAGMNQEVTSLEGSVWLVS